MKKIAYLASIWLILSFVSFAYAEIGMRGGPEFHADFTPVVGSWAEYKIAGETILTMKIAIVGKEGSAYWYETVMESKGEGRVISKMLVSGNPKDQKNIKRMIVKAGSEPAIEMPVMMESQSSKNERPVGKMINKGTETITVPAGTFKTQHMQYQDGNDIVDVWVNQDVAPYGMIKSKSKDHEMILTGHGSGAKTQITEKPRKFEMLEMPKMPEMPGMR